MIEAAVVGVPDEEYGEVVGLICSAKRKIEL